MKKLSAICAKFHKLHLGLYFLFSLMVFFGNSTAQFFEKSSLIDRPLLKSELEHAIASRAKGGAYQPSKDVYIRIFRPVNYEPHKVEHVVNGKAQKAVNFSNKGGRLDLYCLLLVVWLWPLYRHHFSKKPQDIVRIESRIINLPIVIFVLGWAMALQLYFVKVASYTEHYAFTPDKIKVVFAVSSLLFAAFVSYLNLELTGLYIRRRVARPFFLENNPYGLKKGFAVSLTLRYALMMFSLAMVPLVLSFYIPVFANFDIFSRLSATRHTGWDWALTYENLQTLIPILLVALLVATMLVFQSVSVFLYRVNVQAPVSALVRRMRAVAAGDLNCKTSVLYADEFGQLKGHFNMMLDGLKKTSRLENELAVFKATSDLAAQVAHDIRSPLAALGAAAKRLDMPAEQRKLMEGAVGRMQGIADELLQRYRAAPLAAHAVAKSAVWALGGLIEQVLSEKRMQHKDKTGIKIEFNGASGKIKAMVDPKELQRLLSNLVNNSIEAFDKDGTVAVSLAVLDGKVLIEVRDNGKGIPAEILAKLGQKGETHGKAGGNGLGLFHARTTVESWGGNLKIGSEQGKGTVVLIELPRPEVSPNRMVVLLDDDMLVHMNWKLAAKAAGVGLKAYKTREDFAAGTEALAKETPLYIDSDLGNDLKGEDIAKELHEKGFTDITMATGHGSEKFSRLPWLKIIGKEPPWGI